MKNLIEKIGINEKDIETRLKWLGESFNNGLNEASVNDLIRYLLRKVSELESKVEFLDNKSKDEWVYSNIDNLDKLFNEHWSDLVSQGSGWELKNQRDAIRDEFFEDKYEEYKSRL